MYQISLQEIGAFLTPRKTLPATSSRIASSSDASRACIPDDLPYASRTTSGISTFLDAIMVRRERTKRTKEKRRKGETITVCPVAEPSRRCPSRRYRHCRPSLPPSTAVYIKSRFLEFKRHITVNGRIPLTIAPGAEKPIFSHAVHFSQAISVWVQKTFLVCCLKWVDIGKEYIEIIKGDLQMLTTFKEFWSDCHRHFKKYSDPKEARLTHQTSNHERTRLLDRSNLTIIATGQSRFYNDSMSSLRKKESRSTVWSCFGKLTFEPGRSYHRSHRMRIPSLPQRVVSHSLRMRYAIRCWVDDRTTQKALVGDPSQRRTARRRVRAVPRCHVLSRPQKERFKYKLNLIKLWNGLNCKIEITRR
ncbi:NBS-LRR type resistance protein [Cucumis melo var. makuwa]|uniref:NBS-LRR type resistance protein n=1 Tax=Cucumis melo var. makuwa TaxID=1194695 RepID=A0A5D3CTC6_CUCMM|nr:NBS-LRR type resistance protein [Cucumis melo var. makuwa]TYK14682.1 NBS-LRR type resistance protein [Cucumis melo var. makuwa]